MATVRIEQWTGHESRCLRTAMHLSLRDFASRLGVAHRTVCRWESGGTAAVLRPDSQALLDTMLYERASDNARHLFADLLAGGRGNDSRNAPLRQQQAWVPTVVTPTVDNAPQQPPTMPVPAAVGLHHEDDDVNRRRFLQAFTSIGLTGPGSMVGWEALRHDLVAAVGGDVADLAEWDAIAWEYGSSYVTTPPVILLQELAADMVVARDQLGRLRDEQQRRGLQRVVAQLATYTAQTASNLGNSRESARWRRMARQAADASGNAEVRVWVRGMEIVRGLYEHRPLEPLLHLADEAMAITDQPGLGTGNMLGGRAQALAMLGRVDEARQALVDVYDLLDRQPARISSDIGSMYGWPEYRLRHVESFVFTHIGDNDRAEAAQEQALDLYPDEFFRERALVRLHRAMRMVRAGEPAAGVDDACTTLSELPESHRIDMVREVGRWTAAAIPVGEQRRAEVAQLREMLALPAAAR